ncbi:hypothetical protein BX666DRAFT_1944742 [Dichotomocladium elegans]|nr:hypothetical protein BX666DRAFT_1944742 [Dichotomocladium elegans]
MKISPGITTIILYVAVPCSSTSNCRILEEQWVCPSTTIIPHLSYPTLIHLQLCVSTAIDAVISAVHSLLLLFFDYGKTGKSNEGNSSFVIRTEEGMFALPRPSLLYPLLEIWTVTTVQQ